MTQQPTPPILPPEGERKPVWTRWWMIALSVFVVAVVLGSILDGGEGGDSGSESIDLDPDGDGLIAGLVDPTPTDDFEAPIAVRDDPGRPPLDQLDLEDLSTEAAGLVVRSGSTRLRVHDQDGVLGEALSRDEERLGSLRLARDAAEVILSMPILVDSLEVGAILITDQALVTAIDVDAAKDGMELVTFQSWTGESEAVIATVGGSHLLADLEDRGGVALCSLIGPYALSDGSVSPTAVEQVCPDGSGPLEESTLGTDARILGAGAFRSAQVETSSLVQRDPTPFSRAVRAATTTRYLGSGNLIATSGTPKNVAVIPHGSFQVLTSCPKTARQLEQRIDDLEREAQIRLLNYHRDLVELLSDEGYWRSVIEDTLSAVGIDGDPRTFLQNQVPGVTDAFWKGFSRAILRSSPDSIYWSKMRSWGHAYYEDINLGYNTTRQFDDAHKKVVDAFRKGIERGGKRSDFSDVVTEKEAEEFERISELLNDARDALDPWFGEADEGDIDDALEAYDKAVKALEDATYPYSDPIYLSYRCPRPSTAPTTGPSATRGDPHLVTFDGYPYEFQAAGEFVLARSTAGDLEIQARFAPVGTSRSVTLPQAVGVRIGNDVVATRRSTPGKVIINGEERSLNDEETVNLPSGRGTLQLLEKVLRIRWADGSELRVGWRGGLDLRSRLALVRADTISGLWGDADGRPENELVDSGGSPASAEVDFDQWLYGEFSNSWRVSDETSLLPYLPGETTATFTDRSIPDAIYRFDSLSETQVEAGLSLCREAGVLVEPWLSECVYDVALSGDGGFADAAREALNDAVDMFRLDLPPSSTLFLSAGSVGPGSGVLTPGSSVDLYEFELEAGERVWMETTREGWPESNACNLGPPEYEVFAKIIGSTGVPITDVRGLGNNCPRVVLTAVAKESGTYVLQIGDPGAGQWTDHAALIDRHYGVSITRVAPPEDFTVELGDEVTPGSHGEGSGVLATPGASDALHIQLDEGDRVGLQPIAFNGDCSLGPGPGFTVTVVHSGMIVLAPGGRPLEKIYVTDNCAYASEGARWFEAPEDGEYAFVLTGNETLFRPRSGTYEVRIDLIENLMEPSALDEATQGG